jgi:hypothetical protein
LIEITIANPIELQFGQEVLHGDLKCLNYDLVDMQNLTPMIQEVMEFQKWLTDMQILEKSWEFGNQPS